MWRTHTSSGFELCFMFKTPLKKCTKIDDGCKAYRPHFPEQLLGHTLQTYVLVHSPSRHLAISPRAGVPHTVTSALFVKDQTKYLQPTLSISNIMYLLVHYLNVGFLHFSCIKKKGISRPKNTPQQQAVQKQQRL